MEVNAENGMIQKHRNVLKHVQLTDKKRIDQSINQEKTLK